MYKGKVRAQDSTTNNDDLSGNFFFQIRFNFLFNSFKIMI